MKLDLNEVAVGYKGIAVLKDVSFTLNTGEVLCILGPNGSGKTTLFKTIMKLKPPLSGVISIDGCDISKWPYDKIATYIGYIPQNYSTVFPYTALEMVLMGRTPGLSIWSVPKAEDIQIALDSMKALSILHLKDKIFTKISGGERQLVLIARAIAQQTKLLIMDEPTNNLDFGNQVLILNQIKKLSQKGIAVIMATHVPEHAFLYADKVLMVKDGYVLAYGKSKEILSEENLKKLYGVNLKLMPVASECYPSFKVCIPGVV
ncbi:MULTISPECIES: ABC transporter ATP-binding protein [Tepidanaerobacter]|uniref:ABC transporter ATP-binding protein n=1 Tax=Tepidanaerobacter TaxID=499228 RepID=UPI00020BF174|nr:MULTISPECIES: ABC transporter ATP-binding protein [Tepidanaerobacter]AEE90625.1 Phosphonate-transporting ATPase [Tepidanaerobacter acetatoxydans Re1]